MEATSTPPETLLGEAGIDFDLVYDGEAAACPCCTDGAGVVPAAA